jgi:tRNA (guanine37-N1)-methyltransferase
MSLFRPPIVRSASATLNRALFSKTIPIAAARVANVKNITRFRTQLDKSGELAKFERIANIQSDPDPALAKKGGKCMLLTPEVKAEGMNMISRPKRRKFIYV